MLCVTCYGMIRGQRGRQWRGTYALHFDHHGTSQELSKSSDIGCFICRILADEVSSSGLDRVNESEGTSIIQALLSEVVGRQGLYRLDFRFEPIRRLATFFLQQLPNEPETRTYTPSAESTGSQEALQLARHWISTCTGPDHRTCPDESFEDRVRTYPSRMIELPPYNSRPLLDSNRYVRLVNGSGHTIRPLQTDKKSTPGRTSRHTQEQEDRDARLTEAPRGQYVTLSYSWGLGSFKKLLERDVGEFQRGIRLSDLTRTFREAIDFACRLRKDIRYIWIDALCIVQDDPEDWRTESLRMYDVYRNSFCNLSATAGAHGEHGLYQQRESWQLWEHEVNLNTEGIPALTEEKMSNRLLGIEPLVRRCCIQDASFWSRLVDDAPANRRAWVLQERLLAPRVLHFCKNQIAWECRHLDASESFPHGTSSMEIQAGDVRERKRMKCSIPQEYGILPLVPDFQQLSFVAHENWRHIVERYSTTSLSKPTDKLIALAGVAEFVSRQIGRKVRYVAGLWEKWLASQLLWRVNPQFESNVLLYPQRRPDEYCAPSFSWAAVKSPEGIKCGETVSEDHLYISVNDIHLENSPGTGRFGQVQAGCYLELTGTLLAVHIEKHREAGKVKYRWRLDGDRTAKPFSNLYLDAPETDIPGSQARAFCMRARKDGKGYIHFLVLQLLHEEAGTINHYRRIGLAKVPPYKADQSHLIATNTEPGEPSIADRNDVQVTRLQTELRQLQQEYQTLKLASTGGGVGLDTSARANIVDALPSTNKTVLEARLSRIRLY